MSPSDAAEIVNTDLFDIEIYCLTYDCDGTTADSANCLGADPQETLASHGGTALGAKIAAFDFSYDGTTVEYQLAANELWNASAATGARIHVNSVHKLRVYRYRLHVCTTHSCTR